MKSVIVILFYVSLLSSAFASEFNFTDLRIEISQTAINKVGQRDGFLKVSKQNKIITEKTFKEMESLGGSSGFFLPRSQPRRDLFFVTKLGDYDGRLLVITKKGHVLNLPMGDTYADDSFLYAVRQSETEGHAYAIVDLKHMKLIKESNAIPLEIKSKIKKLKPIFPGLFYQSWLPLTK
jgi:hypothetical protein